MNRKKILIALGVVLVISAIVYANFHLKGATGTSVTAEKIQLRDLEAMVSASGKIQPKRSVNVSAETSGKIVNLAVDEGDRVKAGQFLLQIDPRILQSNYDNHQASLDAAQSTLAQTQQQVENAQLTVKQAEDSLVRQEGQWKAGLISRQDYENAVNNLTMQKTNLRQSQQSVRTQETRIKQEQAALDSAKIDLNKVRIESPIDGIVTKRNIEEGETAVLGTMNNAGTVLLTIADLSIIQAEIDVDETDIPFVTIGEHALVSIDAFPDKKFAGKVTEVGNSPIVAAAGTTAAATNFKVVVTIDDRVPDVRPGFTCTAVITTANRTKAVAVPIQATTVREMIVDEKGEIVRDPPPAPGKPRRPVSATASSDELKPGQSRKEIEGVFTVKDGRAVFTAVKVGIAGEKFFEVLSGLKADDQVITGPFNSVRNLKDGDPVTITTGPAAATPAK